MPACHRHPCSFWLHRLTPSSAPPTCRRRISAEAALQDPWLRDMTSSSRAPASSAAPAAAPAAAAVCASSAASNVLPGLPGQHRERAAAKAAVSAAA